jgi:hypothetical protein
MTPPPPPLPPPLPPLPPPTGVVGIDVTTCNVEKQLYDANPTIQVGV